MEIEYKRHQYEDRDNKNPIEVIGPHDYLREPTERGGRRGLEGANFLSILLRSVEIDLRSLPTDEQRSYLWGLAVSISIEDSRKHQPLFGIDLVHVQASHLYRLLYGSMAARGAVPNNPPPEGFFRMPHSPGR